MGVTTTEGVLPGLELPDAVAEDAAVPVAAGVPAPLVPVVGAVCAAALTARVAEGLPGAVVPVIVAPAPGVAGVEGDVGSTGGGAIVGIAVGVAGAGMIVEEALAFANQSS